MDSKVAYSINELAEIGPVGRSLLFEAIKAGDLVARKAGRRTIVLRSDFERWLSNLPQAGRAGRAA